MLGASTAAATASASTSHISEDLALDALGDVAVGAQHEPVGLDADLAQRGGRSAGSAWSSAPARREVGHERDVQEEDAVAADLVADLAGGSRKGSDSMSPDRCHRPR